MENYNRLGYSPEEEMEKQEILKKLFAEAGDGAYIQAPYHAMWGGHIGDHSIIGAASVVTKDVPANVIAIGNPAKTLREITPDDDVYYDHGKLISENIV